jgi:hypothetical protein
MSANTSFLIPTKVLYWVFAGNVHHVTNKLHEAS